MSRQANPTLIGAFVVGAIILVVTAILVFTDSKLFTEQSRFVIYFEGSVNGLKVGAPVKLKGVHVGQVTDVHVELNLDKAVVRTPVFIEVDMNSVTVETSDDPEAVSDMTYVSLIRHGLRAQLKSQSLLTGQLYIEINFYPDSPINLVGGRSKYAEIPSLPSETDEIFSDIGIVIGKLKNLPLEEFFSSLVVTANSLEKLVNSPDAARNLRQIGEILTTLNAIASKLNRQVDPLVGELTTTVSDTRKLVNTVNDQVVLLTKSTDKTLAQTQRSLAAMENVAGEDSPLYVDLSNALEELSDAARSMRSLADYLQRNPDAILFGKPGHSED
ncbi:MAG: MlaD family protein [Methylococcaceae bacterium]|nr:MlaD family protein [Methylococcaceae bacterium]